MVSNLGQCLSAERQEGGEATGRLIEAVAGAHVGADQDAELVGKFRLDVETRV